MLGPNKEEGRRSEKIGKRINQLTLQDDETDEELDGDGFEKLSKNEEYGFANQEEWQY